MVTQRYKVISVKRLRGGHPEATAALATVELRPLGKPGGRMVSFALYDETVGSLEPGSEVELSLTAVTPRAARR